MSQTIKQMFRIAIITLIQEGAVKIGGEHAMLFPYVEQIIRAANILKERLEIIPFIISPLPKKLEKLPQVEELKVKMAQTNNGEMILVSNGADEPYADPWNWEKYGYEANLAILRIVKERDLDGLIVMGHGFASIPAILDLKTSHLNGAYKQLPIQCYAITHSTFDEHKDNRPQRKILEKEIQNHAKMIAISPYMAQHLENIGMISRKEDAIPLFNALPEKGWFSDKIPIDTTLEMINERNKTINHGSFYGIPLPIDLILEGKKELVVYFGRAQKYVKGTDAIINCANNDPKRHYLLICSGSKEELDWHLQMIKTTKNITLDWEHNSKFVLGIIQLAEKNPNVRISTLFLSRREPMGLVSREVIMMQDEGTVLPIVSDRTGFDDHWQRELSFVVTNPCYCEDDKAKHNYCTLTKGSEIFIHDECIRSTLYALDKLSKLSTSELKDRVKKYKIAIKANYSQNSYLAFYLSAISNIYPNLKSYIDEKIRINKLDVITNI